MSARSAGTIAGATVAVISWLAAATPLSGAGQPALDEVLDRTAAYIEQFHRDLSAIVAEETYVQEVRNAAGGTQLGAQSARFVERRTLKSDLLLVRPDDSTCWVQFRDVFEVDGRPVRDRTERVTRLFLQGDSAFEQMGRIIKESARYNIGDIHRTINVPLLPLTFLERANRSGLRLRVAETGARLDRDASLPDSANFSVSTEVWLVTFEETRRPTLVRFVGGDDLPSRGRFWIEPGSGRVLMSELIVENSQVKAQIHVSYQSEALLGLLVPVEMRERYTSARRPAVDGTATYGRFRKFQVATNEEIATPKDGAPGPR
jgi:hypothetical protein